MKKAKLYYPLYVFLLLFITNCAFVSIPFTTPHQPLRERVVEGEGESKILLLDISGVISEQKRGGNFVKGASMLSELKEALRKAESDKQIRAVILRINSPGGTVTASDIIHHEINLYKKKTGNKVIACIMDMGTSGGYYIAAAADEIICHPTSITGSIGVIAMKFNISGLMSKIGIETNAIKSGEKKDFLSPFRTTTPEEQKIMQTIIDKLHKRFVEVIVNGRKSLSTRQVRKLADGRIYTADQALKLKLIDRIGYLDDTIEDVKKSLNIDKASIVVYFRPGDYKGTIYSGKPSGTGEVINVISIKGDNLTTPPGVRFMYYWAP